MKSNSQFITLAGGILALVCFFLPWVKSDYLGTSITASGFDIVTKQQVNLITIAFIAAVAIIGISVYMVKKQTPWKSKWPVLISSAIGLGCILLGFLRINAGIDTPFSKVTAEELKFAFLYSAFGTILGFILSIVGVWKELDNLLKKLFPSLIIAYLIPLITLLFPSVDYGLRIVVFAYLYMLLAIGLNIVPGFTGLLDLGYVGFYLVGGYTAGLLMTRLGWSYWVVLPLAAIHGALWGLLRGAPTLRLTGDYFAIVTFGFAELLFRVVKNETWLIGGPNGFVNDIPRPNLFGYELNYNVDHYCHILILLCLTIFVVYRLQHSRIGRAWAAIREDEPAAACMGINLRAYKSLAFAVSAAIGGVGGAFYAQFSVNISAPAFEFWESIFILCMVVLGGMGSITGAIVGGGILGALGEVLRFILPAQLAGARYLIFGILLIVMMRFRPAGLWSQPRPSVLPFVNKFITKLRNGNQKDTPEHTA